MYFSEISQLFKFKDWIFKYSLSKHNIVIKGEKKIKWSKEKILHNLYYHSMFLQNWRKHDIHFIVC